jgi:hypothetical protein
MKVYYFDKLTFEYIKFGYPQCSPLEEGAYLLAANATTVKPPSFNNETQTCTFSNGKWSLSSRVIPLPQNIAYLTGNNSVSPFNIEGALVSCISSEDLDAGDFVNLYTDLGIFKCRKANSTILNQTAGGFTLFQAGLGDEIMIHTSGQINTSVIGLIPGTSYYIDPLHPGKLTAYTPTSTQIQSIGIAITDASILFISEIISNTADKTSIVGILKGDGSVIRAAVPNSDYLPVTNIDYLGFDTTPTVVPTTEGTVSWNDIYHTLNLQTDIPETSLQVGQEEWIRVKNVSGVDILDGMIVRVTGASSGYPTVGLCSALSTDGTASVVGMATQVLPNGGSGFVTTRGVVRGYDTSSFTGGQVLYLSETAGELTSVRPYPPSYTFAVAITLDSAVDGSLYVRFGSPDANIVSTDAAVASGDPTGFTYNSAITTTYDSTARTVTLTGNLQYMWRGSVRTLTSPWTSPAHGTLNQNYFLYSTDGINFTWKDTVWAFSDLIVSYVYYGATDKIAAVETHGTMSWQAHEEFHTVIGTYKQSGGVLGAYVLNSTTAANRRPTVTTTVVKDEDILTSNPALTNSLYTRMYLTGADVNTFTVDTTDIVALSTNQPYYNQFVTPNWVQTLMTNNSYMSIWLIAVPVASDATSQKYRYLWMQGQTNGTLLSEQALYPQDLNLGQFKSLFAEFVFCAKVILQYTSGNWKFVSVTMLTGTKAVTVGSPSGVFLPTVEHDTTLTGDGTVGLPLGVLLTSDPTPLDTDQVVSLRGTGLLRTTWTVLKAYLKTYFDTLYNLYVLPTATSSVLGGVKPDGASILNTAGAISVANPLNQNTTGSAAKLTTARTIAITGPITYTSPSFDGSGNVTAAATVTSQTGSGSTFVMNASPSMTTPIADKLRVSYGGGGGGTGGEINFGSETGTVEMARLSGAVYNSYSGTEQGSLRVFTRPYNAGAVGTLTERFRFKLDGQVRFVPLSAAPTTAVEEGDVYYDSTTHKLYCYNGASWVALF